MAKLLSAETKQGTPLPPGRISRSSIGRRYGWKPDLKDHRDLAFLRISQPRVVPPKVDLSSYCPPIMDQGQLGSCTANALAGLFATVANLSTGHLCRPLSRLFIYYNERSIEGTIERDAGAAIRDGIKTMAYSGVCEEVLWPYHVWLFAVTPDQICYDQGHTLNILQYNPVTPTINSVVGSIADGHPVAFGFSVYSNFEGGDVAETGKLEMPDGFDKLLGGHAIYAVGYDTAKQTLLCVNSWGADWGMKGFFTMPFEYLDKLSSDFWTITVIQVPEALYQS